MNLSRSFGKLIRILIIVFSFIVLFDNVFADENAVEIRKIEVVEMQIKYNLNLKGENFLSNLAIVLLGLGSSFVKDSKEIVWIENFIFDEGKLIRKELKINNSKKTVFYLLKEKEQYYGKINFEQNKELDKYLIRDLFSLLEFLEDDIHLESEFSFSIKDEYKLLVMVVDLKNCSDYPYQTAVKRSCQSAFIIVDIFDGKDKKIINIEAEINKDGESKMNGKIKSVIIKTLFWPRITAIISLKE